MKDRELRVRYEELKKRVQEMYDVLGMLYGGRSMRLEEIQKGLAILAEGQGIKRKCKPMNDQTVIWDLLRSNADDQNSR